MAYVKNIWVDREGQVRYHETIDDDGALIFTPDYEKVTEIGTPVNADNMNHIEEGIGDHEDRITILEEAGDASNFLNKTQITNCITEIPQRIKLELNNGTLTLKAGSEVIVPNGVGVFDEIKIANDLTASYAFSTAGQTFLYYNNQENVLFVEHPSYNIGSGNTGTSDGTYYYTDSNYVIRRAGGANGFTISFPLAKITVTSDNRITSVDQVFNGFGYIGSSAWIDKGVKGLIPNGRNADGTLKNIEFTTPNLQVRTWTYESINQPLFYDVVADGTPSSGGYYVSETEPVSPTTNWIMWYNPQENIMRYSGDNGRWTVYTKWLFLGVYTSTSNSADNYKLTQFTSPKTAFRAVDYNEALREVGSSKSGYCKLSNGLIIQWGQTGSFSGTTTVTLPTPFSTTDYRPLACGVASGDYDANWDVRNYTTTSFQINQPSSGKKIIAWHAIGY